MKVRIFLLFLALLVFASPASIYPEEPVGRKKIAPIRHLPGHRERKKQADTERRAVESGALAPAEPLPPPTPRAPVIGATNFAGMDFGDSDTGNPGHGFVPPDTHAATGPNHIIETINTAITIYNRSDGSVVSGPTNL